MKNRLLTHLILEVSYSLACVLHNPVGQLRNDQLAHAFLQMNLCVCFARFPHEPDDDGPRWTLDISQSVFKPATGMCLGLSRTPGLLKPRRKTTFCSTSWQQSTRVRLPVRQTTKLYAYDVSEAQNPAISARLSAGFCNTSD